MNANQRRILQRLVAVRTRERDRAGAEVAAAETRRAGAEDHHRTVATSIDDHDDDLAARAEALDLFHAERDVLNRGLRVAADELARTDRATTAARLVVSNRERALRIAETGHERAQKVWAARTARREQGMVDDLNNARRRRSA